MPDDARVSVDVVSTHFAHRRQRKISTEAIGGDSMLYRGERSESDDEYEDVEEELP